MAAPGFHLLDGARSDTGLVRASNEDACLVRPEVRLWAVADGMGGHEDGEWASATIVRTLDEAPMIGDFEADGASVATAIHAANALIRRRAEAYRLTMGSTVAALLIGDHGFAAFWAGDSRIYRLRDGVLVQLTTDHTQVQSKVSRGLMTPDEARSHPMAHVLTRAVGAALTLELSEVCGNLRAGDVFVLCSDGLHGVVPDAEIAAALQRSEPQTACDALLARCLAEGAPDNVTVVAVAVSS